MENLFGSIDLTVLGKIVRQHPELVRKVNFKDGEHQLISIDVRSKREQDQYGNVATIKASCKKDQQKEGLNYYIANLKVSQYQDDQHGNAPQQTTVSNEPATDDALPF